jgi:hypothetical protein
VTATALRAEHALGIDSLALECLQLLEPCFAADVAASPCARAGNMGAAIRNAESIVRRKLCIEILLNDVIQHRGGTFVLGSFQPCSGGTFGKIFFFPFVPL